jgi:cold shock CspA family protein
MATGIVARILKDKKFGFVKDAESGKEYFFHSSEAVDGFHLLNEGDRVTFDADDLAPKGPRASEVTLTA